MDDPLPGNRAVHVSTHRHSRDSDHTKAGPVARQGTEWFAVLASQITKVVVAAKQRAVPVHIELRVWRAGMDWTLLWIRKSWFESDIPPPDMGEGFWNNYRLLFWVCENMVDGGELLGNYGAGRSALALNH